MPPRKDTSEKRRVAPRRPRGQVGPNRDAPLGEFSLKPAGLTESEQAAFQTLVTAISERRLLPGVRLVEEDLAANLDVSRERIRRVLLVLSQHDMVRMEPNRGAYVARPTATERRDTFETRRLVERHVVAALCGLEAGKRDDVVRQMREHIAVEDAARLAGDRTAELRLSAAFHFKLAAHAGNRLLLRILQDVTAQMALAMAAHYHGHAFDCSLREHEPLLDAIAEGDGVRADALIVEHLKHMEDALAHGLEDDLVPRPQSMGRHKASNEPVG